MSKDSEREEFRRTVRTELDALYRTAFRMLYNRDEAEDAVQEALDKAWRNLDQFTPGSQMRAWIFRILSNTCLDHLRARARRNSVPFDPETYDSHNLQDEGQLPDEALHSRQMGRLIDAEIRRLSAAHRAVVQLVIIEQFSYEEAARALDLPLGTLRSRLNRARASLCESLGRVLDATPGEDREARSPARLKLVK